MPNRTRFARNMTMGAVAGAIFLTVAMVNYLYRIEPDPVGFFVWGMALMYGAPTGAWLGGAAGVTQVYLRHHRKRMGGGTCLSAGIIVLSFYAYFAAWVDHDEVYRLFAVPIAAGSLFCIYGAWLVLTGRKR